MTQFGGQPELLRFGIHSGQLHGSFAACQRLWRSAEELEYDWFSLIDHFRPHLYPPEQPCFEGSTLLAALAADTTRMRCALLVSPVTWRHPAITANLAATIDHISGGRLEFGVGAGGPDLAYRQYGIAFPAAGTRLDQLDEVCSILRLLWTEPSVDFSGRHFELDHARLEPKPLQAHLPLIVGASGVRRSLRIAAQHADIWNTLASSVPEYQRKLAALDAHCADVGRDPGRLRRSVTFRAVLAPTAAAAAQRAEELLGGVPDEVRAEYFVIGTPARCAEDLRAFTELGVRDFLLAVKAPVDWQTVELFATDVIPRLRSGR